MKKYKLKLELKSAALIGSGEGFGAIIDTDIVFDEVGIPFIPAKRIKGCLRDSATEIQEMFDRSKINFKINIDETFGIPGRENSTPVYFSNLTLQDYEQNKKWLEYLVNKNEYSDILSKDRVLETFTEIRQQTAIGSDGVALAHSLRTVRVLKRGLTFYGGVDVDTENPDITNTLIFACSNFRHLGTKRNRGFGDIDCKLIDGKKEIYIKERLEEICTK